MRERDGNLVPVRALSLQFAGGRFFWANAVWPPTRLTSARNNETTSSSSNIFIWKPLNRRLMQFPAAQSNA